MKQHEGAREEFSTAGHTVAHEDRVRFLDSLAVLVGCHESVGQEFPDGRRPDVLRTDSRRGVLFMGDAKCTESPCSRSSQSRLLAYLRWMEIHVGNAGHMGVMAVCSGAGKESSGWGATIQLLACEAGLTYDARGQQDFGRKFSVVWFLFSERSRGRSHFM
jgi:hypothetical protein